MCLLQSRSDAEGSDKASVCENLLLILFLLYMSLLLTVFLLLSVSDYSPSGHILLYLGRCVMEAQSCSAGGSNGVTLQ